MEIFSKTIYEFLLWANCNNHCKFCHQRDFAGNGRLLSKQEKELSIKNALDYISSENFIKGSHVMVCGGELFDDISNGLVIELFKTLSTFMLNDVIDILYVNTNLLTKNINDIIKSLYYIDEVNRLDKVHFTTSYDLDGRFAPMMESRFKENLIAIRDEFSNLPIITNMIMSKDFCKKVISNSFSLRDFAMKFDTEINLLPYIQHLDDTLPEKEEVFKVLEIADSLFPGYIHRYMEQIKLNQKRHVFEYVSGKGFVDSTADNNENCGHSINFTKTFYDKSCFMCEILKKFDFTF